MNFHRPAARRLLALSIAAGLVVPAVTSTASAAAPTVSPNLIRNGGAERTGSAPQPDGSKVVVSGWSVKKAEFFTAVKWGAPDFPDKTSSGPKARGKNFFAGGSDGAVDSATQVDSLSAYARWIATGKAKFHLSGWLGGFSSQGDHAVMSVTWLSAKGATVGSAQLATVTPGQRKDVTGMLYRSATGTVPKTAASALITVTMRRTDGVYNDGYADNLGLQLIKP